MLVNDNPEDWSWVYGFENGIDDTNIERVQKAHSLGLQPLDLAIFQAINHDYGQVESRESLAQRSFCLQDPVMSEAAVERCFREGWIQVVTREFEREMRDELREGDYILVTGLIGHDVLREIKGESIAGVISFTRSGAEIQARWCGEDPNGYCEWAIGYDRDQTDAVFSTTVEMSEFAMESVWEHASFEHQFTREAREPVGRWCNRWWCRYESGFRIKYSCVHKDDVSNV